MARARVRTALIDVQLTRPLLKRVVMARLAPRNHVCAFVRCPTVPRDVVDANHRDELAVFVREARGALATLPLVEGHGSRCHHVEVGRRGGPCWSSPWSPRPPLALRPRRVLVTRVFWVLPDVEVVVDVADDGVVLWTSTSEHVSGFW